MATAAIIIPARYGSTRFPGKPLALLDGKPMLAWVVSHATEAARLVSKELETFVGVATDDERIEMACEELNIPVARTSSELRTGTDRTYASLQVFGIQPEIILSLQGDSPLTPPELIAQLLSSMLDVPTREVATPVVQLSWEALDNLRAAKQDSPFSGTTCIRDTDGRALWFSKNIIPLIRAEDALRKKSLLSPIFRHLGLYAFRAKTLKAFVSLPESHYERLEGLEQLRLLENGIPIHSELVASDSLPPLPGIDTPQDLERAELYLRGKR
ncbi:3-deoxy-manno-octulosonate cytidylyltransferase [bacterium]|nr:3-deoxy-manno-octulosonate cytidylyltransferase [bacterium]